MLFVFVPFHFFVELEQMSEILAREMMPPLSMHAFLCLLTGYGFFLQLKGNFYGYFLVRKGPGWIRYAHCSPPVRELAEGCGHEQKLASNRFFLPTLVLLVGCIFGSKGVEHRK